MSSIVPKICLNAPQDYVTAEPELRRRVCSGCGPRGGLNGLVPETIYGLNISEACNIHDWMYAFAEPTVHAKNKADRVFLNNILRIINGKTKGRLLLFLRRKRALKYYYAVKYFGGPFFWSGKNLKVDEFICQ